MMFEIRRVADATVAEHALTVTAQASRDREGLTAFQPR